MCDLEAVQTNRHVWEFCTNEHVVFYRKHYVRAQIRHWTEFQLYENILVDCIDPLEMDWFDLIKIFSIANSDKELASYLKELASFFTVILRLKTSIVFLASNS